MRVSTRDQVICAISRRNTSRVVAGNRVCRYFVTGREGLENVWNNVSDQFSTKIASPRGDYCYLKYYLFDASILFIHFEIFIQIESSFLKKIPFNRGKVSTRGTRPCETMRIEVGERSG